MATFQGDTATEKNGEGGYQTDEGVGEERTAAVAFKGYDGGAVPDGLGGGRGEGDDLRLHGGAECGMTRGEEQMVVAAAIQATLCEEACQQERLILEGDDLCGAPQ